MQSAKKTVTDSKAAGSRSEKKAGCNRRRSIKESEFAVEHNEILKHLYPIYQAMQFATYGAHFKWEASHRKLCVQALVDAARAYYIGIEKPDEFPQFRQAVLDQLHGESQNLRYIPLHTFD